MLKKTGCLFCFVVVLLACSQKESSGVNDYYNLNFQNNLTNGWLDELDIGRVYYDSTITVNGNVPVCIDNENIKKGAKIIRRFTLHYSLGRKVSLPKLKDAEEIEVSVNYKSQNLDMAWLVVYSADENGKLLNVYPAKMDDVDKWTEVNVNISDNQVHHLYVSLFTNSNGLTQQISNLIKEKNINPILDSSWMYFPVQKLWIDRVKINVGGFDMVDFMPEMMPKPEIKKQLLIPLKREDTFSQINELQDKRIIGIGETAHSTKEFPKIAYTLIKERVLHRNCKLVVLELPFSLGLQLNLFVNRETSFDIREIEDVLKPSSVPSHELIDFLLWLKSYNKTVERKVSIVGMGVEKLELNKCLLSFFNEYIPVDSSLFAPVYLDIFNQRNLEAWNKILRNREHFDKILGRGETSMLMHGLCHPAPILIFGSGKKFLFAERDSLMYDRVEIAIDNLLRSDETAVVYGHLGHITKSEVWMPRFVPSVGKYLSDTFGKEYFSIGLISYSERMSSERIKDKTDAVETFWKRTMAFHPAPSYSLEAACESTWLPIFYMNTSSLPSTVLLRHSGANLFQGEFNYYPVKGMDAFIFVERIRKKDY